MIQPAGRVLEGSRDVLTLEIREVAQDLLRGLACSEELQHIDHPHPHAANNARAAAALLGVDSDPFE